MNNVKRQFRLGLIVNPMAGLGGSIALKGSDLLGSLAEARALGAEPKAGQRTQTALEVLKGLPVDILTCPADMGEDAAKAAGFTPAVLGDIQPGETTAVDTQAAVRLLCEAGIDLLLFAGGDGTARDVHDALTSACPVLGIPAGVKIHSGVYAVTPKAAGEVVAMLIRGELVTVCEQEVRDIDEAAFQQGQVKARYYGDLLVPQAHRYIQSVKEGGKEVEELVLADIAAEVIERMEPDTCYIIGSGTTVQAVMDELGLENTLLGIDLVRNQMLVAGDCAARTLLDLTVGQPTRIIITLIGGQGHIFGRGNQQLTPELIRRVGRENILLVATKTKLNALAGRPLLVDTGDCTLDAELSGLMPVITGYRDAVLYPVASV